MNVVISTNYDAAYNMALEEYIYEVAQENQTKKQKINCLLIWQNKNAIIVGINQDVYSECDVFAARENNVQIVRRRTGGGAVYHDLGNLNFSFIQSACISNRSKNFEVIIHALKKFGIVAERGGRNDLYVSNKKVSGNAFFQGKDVCIHHGTLLVNLNVLVMERLLKAKKKEYNTKDINSVYSKVINLNDICHTLTVNLLVKEIILQFKRIFAFDSLCVSSDIDIVSDKEMFQGLYTKHLDNRWIYGERNKYTHIIEEHYHWGKVKMEVLLVDDCIENIQVYSDAIEYEPIMEVETYLRGKKIEELERELQRGYMSDMKRDIAKLIIQNIYNGEK